MSAILHMPSYGTNPHGLPEKNIESFASVFTSVNGRSPTSPNKQKTPLQPKIPLPGNPAQSPVSQTPDNGVRSPTASISSSSGSETASPTTPNKKRKLDDDESLVRVSSQSITGPSYPPPAQYHSGKLPSIETTLQRTLPPLERSDPERRWATEPRELPQNAYHELQPREARPTEPPHPSPGFVPNMDELPHHEQTNGGDTTRPAAQGEPKRRKRQFANRTKTGCGTCRRRKKKCDEAKPECNNCMRGGFICEGYASKVSYNQKNGHNKPPPPLQAKERSVAEITSLYAHCPVCNRIHIPHCEPAHRNNQHLCPVDPQLQTTATDGARPRPMALEDHERKPPAPSNWGNGGWSEVPPPRPYQPEGPLSIQYAPPPPPPPPVTREAHPPHNHQVITHQQQDPSRQHEHRAYQQPPPPPPPPPQTMSQPVVSTPAPVMVANAATHHHHVPQHSRPPPPPQPPQASPTTAPPAPPPTLYAPPMPPGRKSEKTKMLAGQPFHPFDRSLMDERMKCAAAVHQFNSTMNGAVNIGEATRDLHFKTIVAARWIPSTATEAPVVGHYGGNVQVAAPFQCDYGYNLSIADNVVIGAGCQLLDSARICIGRNTKIGARVLISTIKTPTDPKTLKGSNGTEIAQEVWIGENVYIGDGCIIEAGVKIGDGAIVRPGSVVVRDLRRECTAHGNPAFG